MPTRRQLLAGTALTIATARPSFAAAQDPPPGHVSAFNWEAVPGLEGMGRRVIAAAGLAAAQEARLTDATFFVARFASAALGEEAYPLVEAHLLAPTAGAETARLVVTAPSYEDQSSGFIGEETPRSPRHAALLVRDGRDIHIWEGMIVAGKFDWEDAPIDPTAFLIGLVSIAERTFTGDRTEPETVSLALPTGSQMPVGFTIVSETINEPE